MINRNLYIEDLEQTLPLGLSRNSSQLTHNPSSQNTGLTLADRLELKKKNKRAI